MNDETRRVAEQLFIQVMKQPMAEALSGGSAGSSVHEQLAKESITAARTFNAVWELAQRNSS